MENQQKWIDDWPGFFYLGFILFWLLHAADFEVGGREPLAEPSLACEGIVGGETVAKGCGLSDTYGLKGDAVPAETFQIVGACNIFIIMLVVNRISAIFSYSPYPICFFPDITALIARIGNLHEDGSPIINDGIDVCSGAIGTRCAGEAISAGLEGFCTLCTIALTMVVVVAVEISNVAITRQVLTCRREAVVAAQLPPRSTRSEPDDGPIGFV